jgi:cysteinyl-tRNA synthetase
VLGVLDFQEAVLDTEIERLIQERLAARARKDFAASDRIRDDLAARGIILKDTPQGTRWERRNN